MCLAFLFVLLETELKNNSRTNGFTPSPGALKIQTFKNNSIDSFIAFLSLLLIQISKIRSSVLSLFSL